MSVEIPFEIKSDLSSSSSPIKMENPNSVMMETVVNDEPFQKITVKLGRLYCYDCCEFFEDSLTFNSHHHQQEEEDSTSVNSKSVYSPSDHNLTSDSEYEDGLDCCTPKIKVKCLKCTKTFTNLSSLLAHLKKKKKKKKKSIIIVVNDTITWDQVEPPDSSFVQDDSFDFFQQASPSIVQDDPIEMMSNNLEPTTDLISESVKSRPEAVKSKAKSVKSKLPGIKRKRVGKSKAKNPGKFGPTKVFCALCPDDKTTYNSTQIKTHYLTTHPGRRIYNCEYPNCEKSTWKKYEMDAHNLTHLDPSVYPHKCSYCEKSFIQRFRLIIHERHHTQELPFLCSDCGARFNDRKIYNQHVQSHTNNFPCDTCGKTFNHRHNLWRHKKIHLGLKDYCCEFCGHRFSQKIEMINHMAVHTGEYKFPCTVPDCNKKFMSRAIFNQHTKSCHGPDSQLRGNGQPLSCTFPECTRKYVHLVGLQRHLLTHDPESGSRSECELCGKVFESMHRLNQHISAIHRQGTIMCQLCGKGLLTPASLALHMKTHEKYPPGTQFKCQHCNKEFREQRYLTRHLKSHL